jgi:hypothetical protein
MAQKIRHAREALSDVSAVLARLGVSDDVLFELTNIECELEEVYLQLMHSVSQCAPRVKPRRKRAPDQLRLDR